MAVGGSEHQRVLTEFLSARRLLQSTQGLQNPLNEGIYTFNHIRDPIINIVIQGIFLNEGIYLKSY